MEYCATLDELDISSIDSSSTCKVCAKIITIFKMPFEEGARVELGMVSKVTDTGCPHDEWMRNVKYEHEIPDYEHQTLQFVKNFHSTCAFLEILQHDDQNLWLRSDEVQLVAREDRPDHPGRAHILDPEWIDLDTVRRWYSQCEKEHSLKCEQPLWMERLEPVYPDWLIDVEQACVVPFSPEKKRYITLSYTWGQTANLRNTKSLQQELQQPGALSSEQFASQIAETIRNAFGVTKALGERFLWVDSLCIVQDDEETLNRSLNKMHMIYANSFLCIAAKAGQDGDFGLRGVRGVSKPRPSGQAIIDLADGEKLSYWVGASDSAGPDIGGRSYMDRAWTYQEFLFARRLLIFDHGPVNWSCSCADWHEELNPHQCADADISLEVDGQRQWMRTRVPSFSKLTFVASGFNERHLTYPEDVLRAFSGIQSMLHRVWPGGLIFGHPEFFFDISLAWFPMGKLTQRCPAVSNEYLPSWSWMGWQGDVRFPWDCEFGCWLPAEVGFLEPVTQWYTMASPSSTESERRMVESQWHKYKKAVENSLIPLPDGWTRTDPPSWFQSAPRDWPRFSYAHSSDPEERTWYPVPVIPREDAPELKAQTQYLYCVTTRAFFFVDPDTVDFNPDVSGHHIQIKDGSGCLAGILYLNREEEGEGFPIEATQLELVAIAKGWTQLLRCPARGPASPNPTHGPEDDELETNVKASAIQGQDVENLGTKNDTADALGPSTGNMTLASSENTQSNTEEASEAGNGVDSAPGVQAFNSEGSEAQAPYDEPEYWKENKEDCYFVLCIEWDGNVAKRRTSGHVLAHMWEKYKEEKPVELVLG